jgi:hypothetical protein
MPAVFLPRTRISFMICVTQLALPMKIIFQESNAAFGKGNIVLI